MDFLRLHLPGLHQALRGALDSLSTFVSYLLGDEVPTAERREAQTANEPGELAARKSGRPLQEEEEEAQEALETLGGSRSRGCGGLGRPPETGGYQMESSAAEQAWGWGEGRAHECRAERQDSGAWEATEVGAGTGGDLSDQAQDSQEPDEQEVNRETLRSWGQEEEVKEAEVEVRTGEPQVAEGAGSAWARHRWPEGTADGQEVAGDSGDTEQVSRELETEEIQVAERQEEGVERIGDSVVTRGVTESEADAEDWATSARRETKAASNWEDDKPTLGREEAWSTSGRKAYDIATGKEQAFTFTSNKPEAWTASGREDGHRVSSRGEACMASGKEEAWVISHGEETQVISDGEEVQATSGRKGTGIDWSKEGHLDAEESRTTSAGEEADFVGPRETEDGLVPGERTAEGSGRGWALEEASQGDQEEVVGEGETEGGPFSEQTWVLGTEPLAEGKEAVEDQASEEDVESQTDQGREETEEEEQDSKIRIPSACEDEAKMDKEVKEEDQDSEIRAPPVSEDGDEEPEEAKEEDQGSEFRAPPASEDEAKESEEAKEEERDSEIRAPPASEDEVKESEEAEEEERDSELRAPPASEDEAEESEEVKEEVQDSELRAPPSSEDDSKESEEAEEVVQDSELRAPPASEDESEESEEVKEEKQDSEIRTPQSSEDEVKESEEAKEEERDSELRAPPASEDESESEEEEQDSELRAPPASEDESESEEEKQDSEIRTPQSSEDEVKESEEAEEEERDSELRAPPASEDEAEESEEEKEEKRDSEIRAPLASEDEVKESEEAEEEERDSKLRAPPASEDESEESEAVKEEVQDSELRAPPAIEDESEEAEEGKDRCWVVRSEPPQDSEATEAGDLQAATKAKPDEFLGEKSEEEALLHQEALRVEWGDPEHETSEDPKIVGAPQTPTQTPEQGQGDKAESWGGPGLSKEERDMSLKECSRTSELSEPGSPTAGAWGSQRGSMQKKATSGALEEGEEEEKEQKVEEEEEVADGGQALEIEVKGGLESALAETWGAEGEQAEKSGCGAEEGEAPAAEKQVLGGWCTLDTGTSQGLRGEQEAEEEEKKEQEEEEERTLNLRDAVAAGPTPTWITEDEGTPDTWVLRDGEEREGGDGWDGALGQDWGSAGREEAERGGVEVAGGEESRDQRISLEGSLEEAFISGLDQTETFEEREGELRRQQVETGDSAGVEGSCGGNGFNWDSQEARSEGTVVIVEAEKLPEEQQMLEEEAGEWRTGTRGRERVGQPGDHVPEGEESRSLEVEGAEAAREQQAEAEEMVPEGPADVRGQEDGATSLMRSEVEPGPRGEAEGSATPDGWSKAPLPGSLLDVSVSRSRVLLSRNASHRRSRPSFRRTPAPEPEPQEQPSSPPPEERPATPQERLPPPEEPSQPSTPRPEGTPVVPARRRPLGQGFGLAHAGMMQELQSRLRQPKNQ